MALRAVLVNKRSPFLGEACALCKQPFAPGDEALACPQDATRHHAQCWRANGNKCTALGCGGRGPVVLLEPPPADPPRRFHRPALVHDEPRSKVRTLPASSFSCAQGCLLVSIAISILLFAIGCYGLWALADYIALEVLHWPYRQPLSAVFQPQVWAMAPAACLALAGRA